MSIVTIAVPAVSIPPGQSQGGPVSRPSHHLNDSGTLFTNPWPSFRTAGAKQYFSALKSFTRPPIPAQISQLIGFNTPDWGANVNPGKLKATWLGHACFLVELPTPPGAARGPRILFDPVFSHRCSPFSWLGPARFTAPPCTISQLPEVDIVVYSHNHYDHMDKHTLRELMFPKASSSPRLHVFAALNNGDLFKSLSIPTTNFHILDWWQNRLVNVSLPPASKEVPSAGSEHPPVTTTFRLTCTPCQHFSGRGLFDRFNTLWSSWAVESDVSETAEQGSPQANGVKVWFGGDTGYRTVYDGEDEDKVPVCPAFREIGERFGGFDLALIPIGAYLPRAALSPVHCAPQDSVCVFKDIRARKAIGMHWGTWCLSYEQIMEPAEHLKEACSKAGLPDGAFEVCEIGQTVTAE